MPPHQLFAGYRAVSPILCVLGSLLYAWKRVLV